MDAGKTRYRLNALGRNRTQAGFTFLEVIVALALLAVSATILIGMEGAAARRTMRDLRAQHAILAMRSIMSSIESAKDKDLPFGPQDNRPVLELLQELGHPPPSDESAIKAFSSLVATIQVDEFPLGLTQEITIDLRRVSVAVIWGMSPDESVQVAYIRGQG